MHTLHDFCMNLMMLQLVHWTVDLLERLPSVVSQGVLILLKHSHSSPPGSQQAPEHWKI